MNKYLLNLCIVFFLCSISYKSHAQWAPMSDTIFGRWLYNNVDTSLVRAHKIDTIKAGKITTLNINNAQRPYCKYLNLKDIKYFKKLRDFYYYSNDSAILFNNFPHLPNSIRYLEIRGTINGSGSFTVPYLSKLPDSLHQLHINLYTGSYSSLAYTLPKLTDQLDTLDLMYTNLDTLKHLPLKLIYLYSYDNKITSFDSFPNNLRYLSARSTALRGLPKLPDSLEYLDISFSDSIKTIPTLPSHLKYLFCYNMGLRSIPALPYGLQEFDCEYNKLTHLPFFPSTITYLNCRYNNLDSIPLVDSAITYLDFSNNNVSVFPIVRQPQKTSPITTIYCNNNKLHYIPGLPYGIYELWAYNNLLDSCGNFPSSISSVDVSNNNLYNLPELDKLKYFLELYCDNNNLNVIPNIADSTICAYRFSLSCNNNQLTYLSLPYNRRFYTISCNNNNISTINVPYDYTNLYAHGNKLWNCPPFGNNTWLVDVGHNNISSVYYSFPQYMTEFHCDHNNITGLPATTNNLTYLDCSKNINLTCLPDFTLPGMTVRFDSTSVTCVPNYKPSFTYPNISSLPLCMPGNRGGCPVVWNIAGYCYTDYNRNCIYDGSDVYDMGVKIRLYHRGTLDGYAFTYGHGTYTYQTSAIDSFVAVVDTNDVPYHVYCPKTDTLQCNLTPKNSIKGNVNFALECKNGYDAAVWNLYTPYFRPALVSRVDIHAGDISKLYQMSCLSGISGKIVAVYHGPVKLQPSYYSGHTPSRISMDSVIWDISDFGAIDPINYFKLYLLTDTFAKKNDSVTITVNALLSVTDRDTTNNTLKEKWVIVNSYDPNEKSVSPADCSMPDTSHWLTYTIQFQNTGSAPAFNIEVRDTIDPLLNISSFQLLASSSYTYTNIVGNVILFELPNIYLPDSASNPLNSIGYVKYRIKVKNNYASGTLIKNSASIYFDYNPPIKTNTVIDTFGNKPVANFASPGTHVCWGQTVSFVNKTYKGKRFYWKFGDGDTSHAKNPVHAYYKCGTYDVTLIAYNLPGDSSQFVQYGYIHVSCPTKSQDSILPGPYFTCPGVPITLKAHLKDTNLKYNWIPTTGLTNQNTLNPIATVFKPSVYKLSVMNNTGICSIDSAYIYFPDLLSSHLDSACRETSVILSNKHNKWCTYTWKPSQYLSIDTGISTSALPPVTTVYTVTLHNLLNKCEMYDSVKVFIEQPGKLYAIYGPHNPYLGETDKYYIQSVAGRVYNWTIVGGQIINGQGTDSVTVKWTESGKDGVLASFQSLCANYSFLIVNVSSSPPAGPVVALSPNPCQTETYINVSGASKYNVNLYDIKGIFLTTVYEDIPSGNYYMNTSNLIQGTYFIRVIDIYNQAVTKTLIVTH